MANKSPLVLNAGAVEQLQAGDGIIAAAFASSGSVVLSPGGTSGIQVGTGGDTRGQYAVDLQLSRTADTQVASGGYSFLAGFNNTCAANYSAVIGGYSNVINKPTGSGTSDAIIGGYGNTISESSNVAMMGCRECQNIGDSVNSSSYNGLVGAFQSVLTYVRWAGVVGTRSCTITGASSQPINYCAMVGCYGCSITAGSSAIVGGVSCTLSGANSFIAGGNGNTITSTYSFISGGLYNEVRSNYGAVNGGRENTIPVSTGDYNTIGGGYSNTTVAATTYNGSNVIAGGYDSSIQGAFCFVGGGRQNNIVSSAGVVYCCLSGGYLNESSGAYSSIPGGRENHTSGYASVSTGFHARATRHGQHAHSAGKILNNGDAQTSVLIFRNQTSDANKTELFLDGVDDRLILPPNTSWTYRYQLVGRCTSGTATVPVYGASGWGVIDRDGSNNTTLVHAVNEQSEATPQHWIDADDTNESLKVSVNGEASCYFSWVCTVWLTELTGTGTDQQAGVVDP